MLWDPKMHGYTHFAKVSSPMNSAVGPKKRPNEAETLGKHTLRVYLDTAYY